MLNISFNKFTHIDSSLRDKLTVDMISTNDYRICCLMVNTDTTCLTKPQWPESHEVMLYSLSSKIVTILEFVLIIFLNIISLLSRFIKFRYVGKFEYVRTANIKLNKMNNKLCNFEFNVIILNVNDILFGLYLVTRFVVDQYYERTYVVYAKQWMHSFLCKSLGIISIFSMLNSLFLLNLLSLSRLYTVKYSFKSYFRNIKIISKQIIAGVMCNAILCVVIFFTYLNIEQNAMMPSSVCLFLGETLKSITVKTATIMIIVLQMGSFLSITICYLMMWKEIKKSSFTISRTASIDRKVLIQSLLVTVTNVLYWLPSSAIYFTSIVKESYPTNLLLWNVILINPVNSVINPIIFCIMPLVKILFKKAMIIQH